MNTSVIVVITLFVIQIAIVYRYLEEEQKKPKTIIKTKVVYKTKWKDRPSGCHYDPKTKKMIAVMDTKKHNFQRCERQIQLKEKP